MSSTNRVPEQQAKWEWITADDIAPTITTHYDMFMRTGVSISPMFLSPPGGAKTFSARVAAKAIAERDGHRFTPDKRATEPDEFGFLPCQLANYPEEIQAGMPWVDYENNVQMRAMADTYPSAGRGIMLLDEPLQASYSQKFVAQLVHGRGMDGFYRIPDGWFLVLAGNGAKDKSGAVKMYKHLQNRLAIYMVRATVPGALANFAVSATPEVAVYLRWFGDRLNTFDPRDDSPFGSARSWDNVNTVLSTGLTPLEGRGFTMIQGLVGYDNAADFRACFAGVRDLPNIDLWLNDPVGHSAQIKGFGQNNPNVLCSFVYVMLRKYQEDRDFRRAAKAIPVLEQSHIERVAAFIAVAKEADKRIGDGVSILDAPEYAQFMAKYPHITFN